MNATLEKPQAHTLPGVGVIVSRAWVKTETGTPDDLELWRFDVSGFGKYPLAVRRLLRGECVWFAVCQRGPNAAPPVVQSVAGFGMANLDDDDGEATRCCRYLGEGGNPLGANSSSLIASWHGDIASDGEHVAAALATVLERQAAKFDGGTVFLLTM